MSSPTYPYPSPNPADLTLYGPPDWGTPTDVFDVTMALAPGMSEDTTLGQIAKALAYWNAVVAAPKDSYQALLAGYAVQWLTTLQAEVATPPGNTLHTTYPV